MWACARESSSARLAFTKRRTSRARNAVERAYVSGRALFPPRRRVVRFRRLRKAEIQSVGCIEQLRAAYADLARDELGEEGVAQLDEDGCGGLVHCNEIQQRLHH